MTTAGYPHLIALGFVTSTKTTRSLGKRYLKHMQAQEIPTTKPRYSVNSVLPIASTPSLIKMQKKLKLVLGRIFKHKI
jgi:hypothetical protein